MEIEMMIIRMCYVDSRPYSTIIRSPLHCVDLRSEGLSSKVVQCP
jgi:hypothetical protein